MILFSLHSFERFFFHFSFVHIFKNFLLVIHSFIFSFVNLYPSFYFIHSFIHLLFLLLIFIHHFISFIHSFIFSLVITYPSFSLFYSFVSFRSLIHLSNSFFLFAKRAFIYILVNTRFISIFYRLIYYYRFTIPLSALTNGNVDKTRKVFADDNALWVLIVLNPGEDIFVISGLLDIRPFSAMTLKLVQIKNESFHVCQQRRESATGFLGCNEEQTPVSPCQNELMPKQNCFQRLINISNAI